MKYPTVTICGSMRYYPEMLRIAGELTAEGYIVLMPFTTVQEGSQTKLMLDDMHKVKIDMSVAIYVIGSHRGESTLSEIEYAKKQGKDIRIVK
jgi:hypothetical protein